MKIKVFRDVCLDISGVERLWYWYCPDSWCAFETPNEGSALFWDNAIRGALRHAKWHKENNA